MCTFNNNVFAALPMIGSSKEDHMKRTIVLSAMSVCILMGFSTPAFAQATGEVDIDISFPPLIILYYYSDLDVTIPAAELLGILTNGDDDIATAGGTVSVTTNGNQLEGTLTGLDTDWDFADPEDVILDLSDIWAVRSVGQAGGNTQVTISAPTNATLAGSNGGTIVVDDTDIRVDTGSFDGDKADDFPPTGLLNAQLGDVRLELDISGATYEGDYSNAAGGQFTITASSL